MRNKEEYIKFIPNQEIYENISEENIYGMTALVSYNFRMYYGPTKVTARIKQVSDHVEIQAYGLMIVRRLDFDAPIPSQTIAKLKSQGYKISEKFNVAVLNKDLGYLTAQNNEMSFLVNNLHRMTSMGTLEDIMVAIRKEVLTWGELVVDVMGKPVYEDDGLKIPKRDPFAKAGRLALKRKLRAQRGSSIKNFFNDIGGNGGGGKGVDM